MSDEDTLSSPTIDLKKRARRRLVGAAALALFAVIVLPIVMDSEPKPNGQEIQIHIPSQDGDSLATRIVPGNAKSMPLRVQDKKLESAESSTVVASVPKAATPENLTTISQASDPNAKLETPTVKGDGLKKSEAAHAVAVLDGKDGEQWVVQLGAYIYREIRITARGKYASESRSFQFPRGR
jgi:DedD protein